MKKIVWAVVIIILIIIGFKVLNQKPTASVSNQPIKIGQMSALTGIGADIGEEERNGTLLAVEEINARGGISGRPIEMISEDTPAFDLKQGVSVAEKLIEVDKVLAIIGPQWDNQAEVVATVAANKKVPAISQNASTDIEAKIHSPYFAPKTFRSPRRVGTFSLITHWLGSWLILVQR